MAEDDIYGSKDTYESFKANFRSMVTPKTKGYYCRNPANIKHFEKLLRRFEARYPSFVRRLRLLNVLKLICFATDKELSSCIGLRLLEGYLRLILLSQILSSD